MRRRQVKESLYKTVRYKYPDQDAAATKTQAAYSGHLAREELERLKRHEQTRARGVRPRVDPSSSDWHSDGESDPGPPRPSRSAAPGRPTQPGGKRRVHNLYPAARPATSSSSSEGNWGDDLSNQRRHPGDKRRGSQSAPTNIPSNIPYGETPLPRKSGDAEMPQKEDENIDFFEDANSPERWNQWSKGTAAAGTDHQRFGNQNDNQWPPPKGHLSRGSAFTGVPHGSTSKPRGYELRTASNQKAYREEIEGDPERPPVVNLAQTTPDGGRRSSGKRLSHACQEQYAGSYIRSSETVHDEYRYTNHGASFEERNISNECLPPSGNTEREAYNKAERVYRERRMARRTVQKLPSDDSACEFRLEYLRHRGAINLPDDYGRTERWVKHHYNIKPEPLHAETAADTVPVSDNAVSPYEDDIHTSGTRAEPSKTNTTRERCAISKQKITNAAGTFEYSSSEDTLPPLERRRIRFTPSTTSPKNRTASRSYRDIIREEEARALNLTRERKTLPKADIQPAQVDAPYKQGGHWKKTVEFKDTYEYSITGRRTSDATLNLEEQEDEAEAEPQNVLYQPRQQVFGDYTRTNRYSLPQSPPLKKEVQFRKTSCSFTGQREIGLLRPDNSRHLGNGGNNLYIATRGEVGMGDPGSVYSNILPSTKTRHRSAVLEGTSTENAMSGDTTTQFYTCPETTKQVSDRSQTLESDPSHDWWSPISNLLPPLPHKSAAERSEILGSIRGAWHYTDDMAKVPKLQNGSCHNLVVIGGTSIHRPTDYLDGSAVLFYQPRNETWFFFGTMPEPRCYHTAVLVGNSLIVSGGLDPLHVTGSGQMRPSNKVFLYNHRSLNWRRLASMRLERAFHAAVGLPDHRTIVFGGIDHTGRTMCSGELYQPKADQWSLIHPMPKSLMGVAAVPVDDQVWILGGLSRDQGGREGGGTLTNSVYVFDPRSDTWEARPPMLQPRAFCATLSVERDIWIVGGVAQLTPPKCTSCIDFFRVSQGVWKRRAELPSPSHSVRICKAGPWVYMVGGQDERNQPLSHVVVFDRGQRTFTKATSIPKSVAGAAVVLLPQDRMALRPTPWPAKNATPADRWAAASAIQRAYRLYRTGGRLQSFVQRRRCASKVQATTRLGGESERRLPERTVLAPVHIEKWPPRELSSTTVEFQDDAPDAGKYVHHEPLPRNMDPNLGIVLHMDDSFLKTKSVLGLRATPDVLSAGLRSLQQSRQPCDPGCPVILTLGGLDPKNPLSSGSAVLRYHPFKDRWTLVNTMPEPRNYHAVAHLDRTLFVTGGYSTLIRKNGEMVATKTTFTMNVETGGWERLPDMLMHRACHASVATGGKVFVFGGRGRHGRLIATAEEYDISKNRWRPLTSMPEPRMGMAVVAKDGFVLLMGGMSEGENSVVSDVLRYSPQQNSWMAGDCLRHPRAYASAAVIDDCIWLCGGCVNADPKDGHPVSVNTVDVSRNGSGWRKACKLTVARHSAAAAAIGSCIYVLGGINSQEWGVLSRNVLIVTDRKAMLSPSSMPEPVAGHAAVTVSPPTSRYPSSSTKWSDAVFEKLA